MKSKYSNENNNINAIIENNQINVKNDQESKTENVSLVMLGQVNREYTDFPQVTKDKKYRQEIR